jgi:signal transduction histidine kinase
MIAPAEKKPLWAVVGAVISVSIHALRERSGRAEYKWSQLQKEVAVQEDRDRIAERVREYTQRRITTASLILAGTIGQSTEREVASRIQEVLHNLDEVVADLRHAVYDTPDRRIEEAKVGVAHPV